ncbi:tRNA pseudouridine(38-40) synthase TruA [Alkaliphilus peptidifermentans]|uniref:tRNA pseudouridine synthase A n=1 Tax=Alkaliphilus peptidifermentans DSM 18978 TaxID=1120976 RepID=A0A1G5LA39_9FIRM|nr:tRNA pseudouridine(38-40) synthase TruA [Alkaliphilus peptidifermentans]SCZ09029.1 tRNA pseudouridine38-40 synthase [Alkaliphilus peptidifermentans DSM 18978]
MRNIMIEIEYDGTQFCGWQIQPNGRTVQGEIKKALHTLTGNQIKIDGAGRTDAGVHARGQVANFFMDLAIPIGKIPMALNSLLPEDVSIVNAVEMPQDFHARYSAIGKRYSYLIYLNSVRSPLMRNYGQHVSYKIDIDKMKDASKVLLGTHDFKGFMASGSKIINTVRRIDEIDFNIHEKNLEIAFEGNGFLYNMVRIIVGALIELGRGKISKEHIILALQSGNRKLLGPTAPPQGLYLDKVFYPLTR